MKTYSDHICEGASFSLGARPFIQESHVDGPMLVFSDGQIHWLTLWERLQVLLGATDAEKIQRRRRPRLAELLS